MAVASGIARGPAHQHADRLDSIFGPEYFEKARVLLTVARDVAGVMKVGHRLQSKLHERFGTMVEVCMEHVKYEWWSKLHETTTTMRVQKGTELPEVQVTYLPEGIRTHPYKRDSLPTLEVLLLWEDSSGTTRGHFVYSVSHPDAPTLEQVDSIFAEIEPYFAKRWLHVELSVAPRPKGEYEDADTVDTATAQAVPSSVGITVLACHPVGFAREQPAQGIAHVNQCQPMAVRGVTDIVGKAKLCFLPADINKVQVAETESFYGTEVVLHKDKLRPLDEGPTVVKVELTPKGAAALTVHVFAMPSELPSAQDTDGIIDWAAEEREPLPLAEVEVTPLKEGAAPFQLAFLGDDSFIPTDTACAEGCVSIAVRCPYYEPEERSVMILEGTNDFYFPLRTAAGN